MADIPLDAGQAYRRLGVKPVINAAGSVTKYGGTRTRPEVLEVAFGWCPKHGDERRLVTGVNWSAAIINPFRRLGETGRSLDSLLERLRCGHDGVNQGILERVGLRYGVRHHDPAAASQCFPVASAEPGDG